MPGIILQHDLLLNLGEEGGRRKEGREGKKNKKERGEEKEGEGEGGRRRGRAKEKEGEVWDGWSLAIGEGGSIGGGGG